MSDPVAQARGGAAVGLPPGVLLGDLGRRAAAFAVDLVLPVVLLVVALVLGGPWVWLVCGVVAAAWWLVCAALFTRRAAGPGMLALGLQVVALRNGRPLTFGRFLVRSLVLLGLTITVVGLLIMVFRLVQQRRRQGWHDLVAGSVVIVRRALAPRRTAAAAAPPRDDGDPDDLEDDERDADPEPARTAVHPAVEDEPRPVTTTGVLLTEDDLEPHAADRGTGAEASPDRTGARDDERMSADEPHARSEPGRDQEARVGSAPDLAEPAEPATSSEPAEPVEVAPLPPVTPGPTGPVEPDASPDGTDHGGPAEPVEPADPVEPAEPVEPVEPVEPAHSAGPSQVAGPLRLVLDDDRPLEPHRLTLLGRNPQPEPGEADAVVVKVRDQARTVSKLHLAIEVDQTGSYVVDRESTNGSAVTSADGRYDLLAPNTRRRLEPGDVIAFGDHRVSVRPAD